MQHQASDAAKHHAKALCIGMTGAERHLWARLRGEQMGVKFRRQHPLGPYVLDFACLDPKLVIEVDGSQHLDQVGHDTRRDAWLDQQGFPTLRFWANEVMSQTDAVLHRILHALAEARANTPTPTRPQRGRASTEDAA